MVDAAERTCTRLDMLGPGSETGSAGITGPCIEEPIGPAENAVWVVAGEATRGILFVPRA